MQETIILLFISIIANSINRFSKSHQVLTSRVSDITYKKVDGGYCYLKL